MGRFNNLVDFRAQNNISVYIYGAGKLGREFLTTIKNCYDREISVKGFIDRAAVGTVEDYPIFRLSELQDKAVIIVIAVGSAPMVKEIHQTLQMAGFHDIWWFCGRQYRTEYKNIFMEQCMSCQDWGEDT